MKNLYVFIINEQKLISSLKPNKYSNARFIR